MIVQKWEMWSSDQNIISSPLFSVITGQRRSLRRSLPRQTPADICTRRRHLKFSQQMLFINN